MGAMRQKIGGRERMKERKKERKNERKKDRKRKPQGRNIKRVRECEVLKKKE